MATTAADTAAATVNEAGVTGYVQDGEKWVVVEGDKLVEAATAVGATLDTYAADAITEGVDAAVKARGYVERSQDELSVSAKGDALKDIEAFISAKHSANTELYHCVAEGASTFVIYGVKGCTAPALKVEARKGGVVIVDANVVHTMALPDPPRKCVTIGCTKVKEDEVKVVTV